jgi:uncharacterized protein HemX
MSDTSRETQSNPNSGVRPRSRRTVTTVLLLLTVVGISAVVFWATYGQLGALSRAATAQPQALDPPRPRMEASDDTMPSLQTLQQSVQDLQASQQRTADKLDLIQRQLSSEQGERKLLSDQVGALSGRVSGLPVPQTPRNALASSATTGATVQLPKKRPASPSIGNASPPARTGAVRPPT